MPENNTDLCESHMIGANTREWLVSRQACPPLALYHIGLTGISHAAPDFCFIRPQPRMSQLLACFGGVGQVLLDGVWHPCETGQAYLTPPGAPHGYRSMPGGGRWKVCWVLYDQDDPLAPSLGRDAPTLLRVDWRPLVASIECLHRELMGQADPALMQHWAYLVNAHSQRAIGPETRLRQLWERVSADPGHPWTVEELAASMAFSPEHLRRICQAEAGRSPMRYVTELRMRAAATLLASESYSISEVAERVGYDNAFAFSTAFKRHAGVAPSQFRARPVAG